MRHRGKIAARANRDTLPIGSKEDVRMGSGQRRLPVRRAQPQIGPLDSVGSNVSSFS